MVETHVRNCMKFLNIIQKKYAIYYLSGYYI